MIPTVNTGPPSGCTLVGCIGIGNPVGVLAFLVVLGIIVALVYVWGKRSLKAKTKE